MKSTMYEDVYQDEILLLRDLPSRFPRNRWEALVYLAPEGRRVLEIGFGNGIVLYNLRDRFEEIYGVEFSRVRCSKLTTELHDKGVPADCVVGNVEEGLDFPDGFFDVILWADVIEHVVDLWKAMAEVCRLLAPGGTLVTTTPNIAEIRNRLKLLMGRFPSTSGRQEGLAVRPGELFDGGHLHYFTFSSLENLYLKYGILPESRLGIGRLGHLHNIYPPLLSGAVCLVGRKPRGA